MRRFLAAVQMACILVPSILVIGASSAGAQDAARVETEAQVEAVRCAEIAFSRSAETGDWDAFESYVHPEARFPQSEGVGAPDIATKWRAAFSGAERSIRWRPRSVEILKPGELALSRGPYRVLVETTEGSSETWGSFNSVWSFDDGRWRVIFDLGSDKSVEGDRELLLAETSDCPDYSGARRRNSAEPAVGWRSKLP